MVFLCYDRCILQKPMVTEWAVKALMRLCVYAVSLGLILSAYGTFSHSSFIYDRTSYGTFSHSYTHLEHFHMVIYIWKFPHVCTHTKPLHLAIRIRYILIWLHVFWTFSYGYTHMKHFHMSTCLWNSFTLICAIKTFPFGYIGKIHFHMANRILNIFTWLYAYETFSHD